MPFLVTFDMPCTQEAGFMGYEKKTVEVLGGIVEAGEDSDS